MNTDISMASSNHALLRYSTEIHTELGPRPTGEYTPLSFEHRLFYFLEKTLLPVSTGLSSPTSQISQGRWNGLLAEIFRAVELDAEARRNAEEVLCRCVVNVENLDRALDLIVRYPANGYINKVTRQISDDAVLLACACTDRSTGLDVLDLVCYWRLLSWLANESIPARQLRLPEFGNLDVELRHLVEQIFQCPVSGETERAALVVDTAWLDRPVLRTYRDLRAVLGLPSLALIPGLTAVNLTTRITQLIAKSIDRHGVTPSLSDAAHLLGLSPSTLRRKLHREGASFQSIKDAWRQDRARELLQETRASLDDIAGQLGFEGSSVFSRAFKSWTGTAPSTFRREVNL